MERSKGSIELTTPFQASTSFLTFPLCVRGTTITVRDARGRFIRRVTIK